MLPKPAAEEFVRKLYQHAFGRAPKEEEFAHWVERATEKLTPGAIVEMFYNSAEGKRRYGVKPAYPNGHYYSPVVDPKTVREYFAEQHKFSYKDMAGIEISPEDMLKFWKENTGIIEATPFNEEPEAAHRFYYSGSPFPYGDAIILRAMINARRPKRIVEVGSGFSTACMLDTADEFKLKNLSITCVDPDTKRLRGLLRPGDEKRIKIIESPVQAVPMDVFTSLQDGDFLFIDSTHILKTGSDVHHELFSVLPVLKKGVVVHFHDIPYPFEYTKRAVFELNYSWNEAYALRAFLMYNSHFKVLFWNSLMLAVYPDLVSTTNPLYALNPGSGIWLTKQL